MSRVLLVEDDNDLAHCFVRILQHRKHLVDRASDLATARRALHVFEPDFVLLDMMLPDGLGATLIESIRALHPQAKIIILTAGGTTAHTRAAESIGVSVLYKPVHLDQLWGALSLDPVASERKVS
jgi:two-component system OmpR family response regulator